MIAIHQYLLDGFYEYLSTKAAQAYSICSVISSPFGTILYMVQRIAAPLVTSNGAFVILGTIQIQHPNA